MHESRFNRGGLSLDRLRGFLEFAQAGSISKAASGDLSRQSLMSRQIRELEEYFGAELVVRKGKTLMLSKAGQRLKILITEQFRDLEDFQIQQTQRRKCFSFGAGASMLEWLVIPAATKLRGILSGSSLRLDVLRSRDLVEAVRDGGVDFAVVREDALSEEQRLKTSIPVVSMTFLLCVSATLLGTRSRAWLQQPHNWDQVPFASISGGGQLDQKVRQALTESGGAFTPAVECASLLQVRELVVRGVCAGVLPSVGTSGLAAQGVLSREFEPLKAYGRPLVLHWNERQMRRRDVGDAVIKKMARALAP
ncbi:LysR family transcriptional regulator [Prosthecobacter sp.]|uniref:LysR family transcriptional regulator n=1 Tax=Prosthecobacter sp. TaxID=1965333 RepID=UPI0037835506